MPPESDRAGRGFTLIEILVTIVISAVLAVILVQVIINQPWRSYRPLEAFDDTLTLKGTMDNIVSDYHGLMMNDPSPLVTLISEVQGNVFWPAGSPINATTTCMDFVFDSATGRYIEADSASCTDPAVLKLTLTTGTQSLTALFPR